MNYFLIIGPNDVSSYHLNLFDKNVLKRKYGVTLDDVWYFAPRVLDHYPYDVTICLIWMSPFNAATSPDWSTDVSKSKFKITILTSLKFTSFLLTQSLACVRAIGGFLGQ